MASEREEARAEHMCEWACPASPGPPLPPVNSPCPSVLCSELPHPMCAEAGVEVDCSHLFGDILGARRRCRRPKLGLCGRHSSWLTPPWRPSPPTWEPCLWTPHWGLESVGSQELFVEEVRGSRQSQPRPMFSLHHAPVSAAQEAEEPSVGKQLSQSVSVGRQDPPTSQAR